MRILVVGNDPHNIGGVVNYTRPLAIAFVNAGHEVHYLYSGAFNRVYNWRGKAYLRRPVSPYPFVCHELVNSPNWTYQFGVPLLDISYPEADELIGALYQAIRPDVIHVHSRLGLPGSLFSLAAAMGIPIYNTVHVYGMLCQRRVMIDSKGTICAGPESMEKCAECTGYLPIPALKTLARVASVSPTLAGSLVSLRRRIRGLFPSVKRAGSSESSGRLVAELGTRLEFMRDVMNQSIRLTFCVSNDVKATLMRFGVWEHKLKVQHIGSVLAEHQIDHSRMPGRPIIIGNIGGATYYKGTHVLAKAVSRLPALLEETETSYEVHVYGSYDQEYVARLKAEFKGLKITFHGRYDIAQLPGILDGIDLMVLPSICADTAPQTIFESFSRGIPIVASAIGGFPDFIIDGENGRLFPPGDDATLASILANLIREPSLLTTYAGKIPKLKTITQNATELLEIYALQQ